MTRGSERASHAGRSTPPRWALLLVALLPVMAGCRRAELAAPLATPVRTEVAEPAAARNTLRYAATIQPYVQINLAFRVAGYVTEIHGVNGLEGRRRDVQEGDVVPAGTVLARVRQLDYSVDVGRADAQLREAEADRARATAHLRDAETWRPQAVAQLQEAEAARARAVAHLASTRAALDKARRDFARARALYDAESLTRPAYDGAVAALDSAQASADAAQADLVSANSRIAAAQANLESMDARLATARAQLAASEAKVESARQGQRAADIPLDDTALRAPRDVVVVDRKVETGTLVQPGSVAFVVADTSTVKATFGVPENVVRGLRPGTILKVRTDEGPESERRGPVTAIAPAADPQSRIFPVEVTLPNARGDLRIGMVVTVAVEDGLAPPVSPAVPLSAVVRPPGVDAGYALFVVEDGGGRPVARLRRVDLGEVIGNRVVVRDGLRRGEAVVVSGATIVQDGRPVRVVP
jgi:multidrug efflux system membrane fusion protein